MSRAAKLSVIGVDPASIQGEQFNLECLPGLLPVEVSYWVNSFLRPASTPKKHFKAGLEVLNQIVSGFITSVVGKVIAGKMS